MPSKAFARWAVFLIGYLFAGAFPVWAESPLVTRGFKHFYNLEYGEAIADFSQFIAEAPDVPDGYNHLAQAILYRDMFRAGALESELVTGNDPFLRRPKVDASPEDQRQFDAAIRKAVDLANARLAENPRDTGALYALGVSYGLRSNYGFLVRKAWHDALRDATTARKFHTRVTEIDPSFVDARMVQGLHDYIVGSLPLHLRMLGFLLGFHGNREDGIHEVELVSRTGSLNRIDAEIVLCAIYRREKRQREAIPLLLDLMPRFPRNYLFAMELAQMYSDSGDAKDALGVLDRLEAQKRKGTRRLAGLSIEKIWYAKGNIQFWYNDLDAALANLRKATAAKDPDLNTGVLAWMRLGQVYDLQGERDLAVEAYRQAADFAPDSDAAKESRGYISTPYRRKRGT
jgi:tetratricopeptide (TPR) repeat protein